MSLQRTLVKDDNVSVKQQTSRNSKQLQLARRKVRAVPKSATTSPVISAAWNSPATRDLKLERLLLTSA
jgi:hypothetical protein